MSLAVDIVVSSFSDPPEEEDLMTSLGGVLKSMAVVIFSESLEVEPV